ncbi:MATE family efflux transporter [Pseudoalteromonas obscura]|uniref:Multidrug export protein MepA n=1 Tax=Pseudoalteromonas obscura TaxID=3048491 RepID=A0ABT7EKC3_9GAMM|nr:MATE family efflux transporter [Pseudoalteromonas sp. P94(2023)]MDK2595507.1 MATE family efflux transporter [Pseudoalteromonas sp. P94(2023)]
MSTTTADIEIAQQQDSPLLTAPIFKQFCFLAIPTILGMLISGLYSFVDALFISQGIGAHAMGAVSAVFPIQMLLIAISTMLGSGMASLVSRYLGANRQQDANQVFSASFLLAIGSAFILCVLTYLNLDSIFNLLAVPESLKAQATSYITPIILFWVVGFICNQITEGFRASGNPKAMMQVLTTASILNIVLDALFIFVFEWGVAGAAWATICAISIALAIAIQLQLKGESKVQFHKQQVFSPLQIHTKILSLGLPVLLSHGGFSVILGATVYSISTVFADNSEPLITAHGILVRSYMFLFLPVIGMMVALQTLAGFNYGAGQYQRVYKAYIVACAMSFAWGLIVTFILCFKAQWLIAMFTQDQQVTELGVQIALISFCGFALSSFCMMSSGLFQGMGKAIPATMLDAARTYILLLPLMAVLPELFNPSALWWSFPIADIVGGLFALSFSLITLKKLMKNN